MRKKIKIISGFLFLLIIFIFFWFYSLKFLNDIKINKIQKIFHEKILRNTNLKITDFKSRFGVLGGSGNYCSLNFLYLFENLSGKLDEKLLKKNIRDFTRKITKELQIPDFKFIYVFENEIYFLKIRS